MKNKKEIPDIPEYVRPTAVLVIDAGERKIYASLEKNPAVGALTKILSLQAAPIDFTDPGEFAKIGHLPFDLPRCDEQITAKPGDLILFPNGRIALCYAERSCVCTRLARNCSASKERICEALGDKDVSVKLYLEWSE